MSDAHFAPGILFRTRRQYVITLGVGYGVCILITGLFRHYGDPKNYPLLRTRGPVPTPAWQTFQVDPDGNPFDSLTNWRAIITGDFIPIFEAAKGHRADPGFRMYQPEQLRQRRASFVYSPFTALLVSPFARPGISMYTAANWASLVNHLLWIAGAVLLFAMATHERRRTASDVLLFALHYVAFYPFAKALQLTQASIWIFFLLTVSAFLFQRNRNWSAGLTLAVGISIKPHLLAVLAVLALIPRFPRSMLCSCLVGLIVLTGASVWYAGVDNCRDYLFATLPVLSAGYAFFPNQSFNGLLLRLFTDVNPAVFNLAPPVGWIKLVSGLCGLSVLALTWLLCRGRARSPSHDTNVLCYAAVIAAAVVASPVCWIHHLTALAIPFCAVLSHLGRHGDQRRRWLDAALFVSFLLVSFYFDSRYLGGWPAALLSGLEFYGALLLLACLLTLTCRQSAPAAQAPAAR